MITVTEKSRPVFPEGTARSRTRDFIATLMLCNDVNPSPITAEDAAYDMSNWAAEDVELPEGITPALYAEVWNELI